MRFLEDCVYVQGLLDGLPSNEDIDHKWTWPPLPNLDEVDSATAAKIRLKTGQSTPSTEYDLRGRDSATEMDKMATDWGKPVQEVKDAIFDLMFERQPAAMTSAPTHSTPLADNTVPERQEVPA